LTSSMAGRRLLLGIGSVVGCRALTTTARAAVAVTVVRVRADSQREYLLVQRAKPPRAGSWSIPGGKIEVGEPTLVAAARELREETRLGPSDGIRFHPWAIASSDVITRGADGDVAFHFVITQFLAFVRADAQPVAGDDALGVRWVTASAVDNGSLELGGNVGAIFRRAEALLRSGSVTEADALVVDDAGADLPEFLVER